MVEGRQQHLIEDIIKVDKINDGGQVFERGKFLLFSYLVLMQVLKLHRCIGSECKLSSVLGPVTQHILKELLRMGQLRAANNLA